MKKNIVLFFNVTKSERTIAKTYTFFAWCDTQWMFSQLVYGKWVVHFFFYILKCFLLKKSITLKINTEMIYSYSHVISTNIQVKSYFSLTMFVMSRSCILHIYFIKLVCTLYIMNHYTGIHIYIIINKLSRIH